MNFFTNVMMKPVRLSHYQWSCLVSSTRCIHKTVPVSAGPPVSAALKKGPSLEKSKIPVEKDPVKLANFVCGSDISKENPQDVPIKPDSEYPDWLWEVRLGPAPPLEDMDRNTKAYWRRTLAHLKRHRDDLRKLRRF